MGGKQCVQPGDDTPLCTLGPCFGGGACVNAPLTALGFECNCQVGTDGDNCRPVGLSIPTPAPTTTSADSRVRLQLVIRFVGDISLATARDSQGAVAAAVASAAGLGQMTTVQPKRVSLGTTMEFEVLAPLGTAAADFCRIRTAVLNGDVAMTLRRNDPAVFDSLTLELADFTGCDGCSCPGATKSSGGGTNTGLIVGLVIGALFLLALGLLMGTMVRRRNAAAASRSTSSGYTNPVYSATDPALGLGRAGGQAQHGAAGAALQNGAYQGIAAYQGITANDAGSLPNPTYQQMGEGTYGVLDDGLADGYLNVVGDDPMVIRGEDIEL